MSLNSPIHGGVVAGGVGNIERGTSSDKMSSFVRAMSQLQKLSSTPFSFPLSGHGKRKENED